MCAGSRVLFVFAWLFFFLFSFFFVVGVGVFVFFCAGSFLLATLLLLHYTILDWEAFFNQD